MRALASPPLVVAGSLRGLAWVFLEEALRPRLGPAETAKVLRDAGAPDASRLDPFEATPLDAFLRALALAEARGAALREVGQGWAQAWGRRYRHLARQVRGEPRRVLEVLCGEVLPWFFDQPGAARLEDAGPAAAVLRLPDALPPAFQEGLVAGFLAVAGVEGAALARSGPRLAVNWESAAARATPPRRIALLAGALRLPWLAAALVPFLVGAALAWRDGFAAPAELGLTFLALVQLQLGGNALNDYFDHRSRADDRNATPTPFSGGSRVIQRGLLSPGAVLALAAALLAGGALVGLQLAFRLQAQHGAGLAEVLGLGVAGVGLALLYSAPPVRLAHRGLGELAVGLGFGPLVVAGTYLVQRVAAGGGAAVSAEALAFSVPVGALVAAMLLINEFPDKPWDALAGKRTLVVRLRGERAVQGYALLLALAYASLALAAAAFAAWPALLALLPAPFAWRAWRHLRAHTDAPYRLVPANAATARLHLATGLLLVGGLVLARLASQGA